MRDVRVFGLGFLFFFGGDDDDVHLLGEDFLLGEVYSSIG